MNRWIAVLAVIALGGCASSGMKPNFGEDGIIRVQSNAGVEVTVKRLKAALDQAGMKLFGVVNHAAGAQTAGLSLRPTTLVMFGNPKAGTPLMRCAQTTGIDLPMKALVFEDELGRTWFAYNAPRYLDHRHGLSDCEAPIKKITGALARFAAVATGQTSN